MTDKHPITVKIDAYLDGGKVKKPKAKVIAHIYPEIVKMRNDGFSWAQINEKINENEDVFSIEPVTLKGTVLRLKKKGDAKKENTRGLETGDSESKGNAFSGIDKKPMPAHDNNPDVDKLIEDLMNGKQ
ncbi:hypothetical protein [Aeromonas caviae]|uniref:hypothetical protein n=1 Tax=Aeromonas caviae TaxID=648 RepID=UPI0030D9580C